MEAPKVVVIAGVRPQYVKTKAVLWLLERYRPRTAEATVTFDVGQHYSRQLSDAVTEDLQLTFDHRLRPLPGNMLRGQIVGRAISELSSFFDKLESKPAVVVFGDAASVVAGAFAAYNARLPLIHIEAGARRDPSELEHFNSVIVDRLAQVRLAYSDRAVRELETEGLAESTHLVGDVAYEWYRFRYDTLLSKPQRGSSAPVVVSMHRPANMTRENIVKVAESLLSTGRQVRWISFPRIQPFLEQLAAMGVSVLEPMTHSIAMAELSEAAFLVTDSGGLSREAHYLECPVIMRRDRGGWPELASTGFLYPLTGRTRDDIDEAVRWAENVKVPGHNESPLIVPGGGESIANLIDRCVGEGREWADF
ncbi:UDP-N-acetylglucosamine 2-epimerase [Micromonospora zamorensis]|uniref:UDP-N-acetylglucosamine 2-epimerase n=1 Tax=Micromonospora zamorensis TaxID=709883 RepID=UPI00371EF860